MNRETVSKFLPYFQAFAEGKTIQLSDNHTDWYDADANWINFESVASMNKGIRVKPAYRPFKSKDECLKYNVFGIIKDDKNVYSILAFNDNGIRIMSVETGEDFFYPFEYAFAHFTKVDGYPFGVNIEADDR